MDTGTNNVGIFVQVLGYKFLKCYAIMCFSIHVCLVAIIIIITKVILLVVTFALSWHINSSLHEDLKKNFEHCSAYLLKKVLQNMISKTRMSFYCFLDMRKTSFMEQINLLCNIKQLNHPEQSWAKYIVCVPFI